MSKVNKSYLGDSVYAAYDGEFITLTTENGLGPSNIIHLESQVVDALLGYLQRAYDITIEVKQKDETEAE